MQHWQIVWKRCITVVHSKQELQEVGTCWVTDRIYLPNKTENIPTHRANYLGLCIEMTTSHPYAVDFEVAGMSSSQELSSISSPVHLDLPNSCLENQLCSGNKDENLYLNFHLSVQRSHHLQNIELTYQKTDMLRKWHSSTSQCY